MENKIKILKKNNKPVAIEINGNLISGINSIKINNDYTSQKSNESIIVEITNISFLEITSD